MAHTRIGVNLLGSSDKQRDNEKWCQQLPINNVSPDGSVGHDAAGRK